MISGQAIENISADYIPKVPLRPLGDRIFVRPLDWEASKTIIAIRDGRPVRGEAVFCGPGAYETRKNREKTKLYDTNIFVPMTVKPGDIVEFGCLKAFDGQSYLFPEVNWGGERLIVISEKDVTGIRE